MKRKKKRRVDQGRRSLHSSSKFRRKLDDVSDYVSGSMPLLKRATMPFLDDFPIRCGGVEP